MRIWLDTIDTASIELAKEIGLLHGVTTNPSILAQAEISPEDTLERILNKFTGPLAVQTTMEGAKEIVDQGKDLYDFSPRILVKVPVTQAGIEAIHRLSNLAIPTMATAIFDPMQAFFAAQAGAQYVVPYFSHLAEKGFSICRSIQNLLTTNHLQSKLLVASLKSKDQVLKCIEEGFAAVTLKPDLFEECILPPPETLKHTQRFKTSWEKAPRSRLFAPPEYVL